MKIKQCVFMITVLIAFNFVAQAADELPSYDRPGHMIGIITALQLDQSRISIDGTTHSINSLVTVHALKDNKIENLSQLKTDMAIEYKFEENSEKINEIWILK